MTNFDRVLAVADQIKRERDAARPIVAAIASDREDILESEIPPDWRKAGFVQVLTQTASEYLEKEPRRARAIAQLAVVVSRAIQSGIYPDPIPAVIEAEAWKQLGSAHNYLSEFDAALRALTVAEKRLENSHAADWERTLVRFARASVLADLHRLDEAAVLADESRAVFEQYKDSRRVGHAWLLKGMIEHRSLRFDAAAATFAKAAKVLEQTDDLAGLASAHNNFGYSQYERGKFPSAVSALHKALAIFGELNLPGEIARTRCLLASVLLSTHRYDEARELFAAGRRAFRELGMVEEAGIVGISLVDTLLALDRAAEAGSTIDEVVVEFRTASLNERALVALAYLREQLATPRGRDAVPVVKQYLRDLRRTPLLAFLPMPD